jgi:hypothetical protein
MKHFFYIFLVLILFGCEDKNEDIYRYSKIKSEPKAYPVYLDMSEIGNIQVKERLPQTEPFKIVYNDKYCFVGDRLKGIHVYEKKTGSVSYLCFIECRYISDFEIVGNLLFCNNLVDLVVIDVSDPLHINILHRQKNHFNRYTEYKQYWNFPYVEGKGLVTGSETHVLTGTVTDQQPNLDFTEFDQLYGNLTTKAIPDSWFSNYSEIDRAEPGIIKVGKDEVYSCGSYNSWAICTYQAGTFSVREEDLWTASRGKYAPPYYYSDAYPVRMFFEDSMIYILGSLSNHTSGYCDCSIYDEKYPIVYKLYFATFKPLDISYMPQMNAFFALSGKSVWGVFIGGDAETGFKMTYKDYQVATDAVEIFRVGDKLITLGNELSVYSATENELSLVKKYPGISGMCCAQEGNFLTVANTQGLFIYDITNLENIQLIP